MTYTLTILDVSGVQKYLFDSNRLIHNIGASYLVEQATGAWVNDATDGMHSGPIESGHTDCELVYSGGGNAVLLFASGELARQFTRRYTSVVLQRAPGLRVVVQHTDFEWADSLADKYTSTIRMLAKKKAEQTPVLPMLGLSVTAACPYTGLPAAGQDTDGKFISAEIDAKQQVVKNAREKLKADFKEQLGLYDFVYDFNLLGARDEASYLAVVHADGNGMGNRKEAICQDQVNRKNNRQFLNALCAFSAQVNDAGVKALQATFKRALKWIEVDATRANPQEKTSYITRGVDEQIKRVKFVPLVFGGDDVTFVCDGRLGLSLAAIYLQEFNKHLVGGRPLYACAGVAITKNRYPFARAYEMAEQLCQNAKRAVREGLTKQYGIEDALALDWHFAVNGAVLSINDIRAREYTLPDGGKLNVRPYFIDAAKEPLQNWASFRHSVFEFTEGDWKDKRNKVKELREYLRQGKSATEQFLKLLKLPDLPDMGISDCRKNGWYGKTCAYFDAIEAMDLFVDMEADEREAVRSV